MSNVRLTCRVSPRYCFLGRWLPLENELKMSRFSGDHGHDRARSRSHHSGRDGLNGQCQRCHDLCLAQARRPDRSTRRQVKPLELENGRLNRLLIEGNLGIEILKEVNAKMVEPAGSASNLSSCCAKEPESAPHLRAA